MSNHITFSNYPIQQPWTCDEWMATLSNTGNEVFSGLPSEAKAKVSHTFTAGADFAALVSPATAHVTRIKYSLASLEAKEHKLGLET